MNHKQGGLVFLGILGMAFIMGSYIQTAAFFGTITLIGLYVLIESIPPIRWIASRTTRVIDVIIFLFTIIATANFGLNITASLTVAGIGYSLILGPYLRDTRNKPKESKQPQPQQSYKSGFDCR